jgi:type I restriction enzyme M protein
MKLHDILKDSNYALTQFSQSLIDTFESQIIEKEVKGKTVYKVVCLVRQREIELKPEEVVRQLYLKVLTQDYYYPVNRLNVEYQVQFGSDNSKHADIVILHKEKDIPYIVVELKKPKQKEGKEQLKSYCNGTGAPIGVWTNGDLIEYYHRQDPNIFEQLDNIPTFHQTLKDIFNERFTIAELMRKDKLQKVSLKRIIEDFEDEVLANAGVDVFEEAFKLIFSKLFDEHQSGKDKDKINHFFENNPDITEKEFLEFIAELNAKKEPATLTDEQKIIKRFYENVYKNFRDFEFRNTGVETDTRRQIDRLFESAKVTWTGIFQQEDKIKLTDTHLQTCVSYLQDVKLFNSNLEVVDEAFEYLINKDAKGDKGQYFTPRYVIDMCVKMLNPQAHEPMIDTASGSCGFPVHTIFHVWQQLNPQGNNLFTTDEKTQAQKDYVQQKVFAIDFDEKAVRVGRTLNLIAGDGETNVLQMNTLDYERWTTDYAERKDWRKQYGKGFDNLEALKTNRKNGFKGFDFAVLMANPPFAGDIKDQRLLRKYELTKKENGKYYDKISRDVLFIERNIDMLKPGGRMAIVLPQGRFNNSSDKNIREFIAKHCRILAVVGLHGNTFKPHTGTKTSVLFLQKWTDEMKAQCTPPSGDGGLDYPIFFATQQISGKGNSGEKIYRTLDYVRILENGVQEYPLDYFLKYFGTIEENTIYVRKADWANGTWQHAEKINGHQYNELTKHDAQLPFGQTGNEWVNLKKPILINKRVYDKAGHAIVAHDLFSTETNDPYYPHTPEGIAEVFIEFAKKEKLSFFV